MSTLLRRWARARDRAIGKGGNKGDAIICGAHAARRKPRRGLSPAKIEYLRGRVRIAARVQSYHLLELTTTLVGSRWSKHRVSIAMLAAGGQRRWTGPGKFDPHQSVITIISDEIRSEPGAQ